jgi:hypothetical protein
MKYRSLFGAAILTTFFFASESKAQTYSAGLPSRWAAFPREVKNSGFKTEFPARIGLRRINDGKTPPVVPFHKKQFLILSAAVHGASLADMHQTLKERKHSWWYEADPLARPFVKLPAPAYYAVGLAMATSLNWISWKMGHSRRWHRLAAIPQLLAIAGNTHGYKSNLFQ